MGKRKKSHVFTIERFREAAKNWELTPKLIKDLLNAGYDIHFDDDLALRSVTGDDRWGVAPLLQMIIDAGGNIHVENDLPFRSACSMGNVGTMRVLLNNGIDIHFDNDLAIRTLAGTYELERIEFLRELILEKGADFRADNNFVFRQLIEFGSKENKEKSPYVSEASHLETLGKIDQCRYEMIEFILRSGIDANTLDGAIEGASDNYEFDLVFMIARYGGDIHSNNDRPLLNSIEDDRYLDVTKRLVEEFDANVNASGGYPIMGSCGKGMINTVKYLVEHGVDINVDNDLPIRVANEQRFPEIVEYLYRHGANIFAISPDEDTEVSIRLKNEQRQIKNTLEERPEDLGLSFDEINLGKLVGDYYAPMHFNDSKNILSQIHALGFDHVNSGNIGRFREAIRKAYALLK